MAVRIDGICVREEGWGGFRSGLWRDGGGFG